MRTPLQTALLEIRSCVGEASIHTDPETVERLSRCTLPLPNRAAAFVYPSSIDEIQQLLIIANRHRVPVWPCSQGRNWGYGSANPFLEGSIVMVLARLNHILEVNETLAYAVIEPGVTYRQLNAHLKSQGDKLWADCTDGPPDGSVLGNALERGIGETPYGDHFGNLCGLEIVLPSGEVIHTGGGPPGSKTWHTHKWGIGPYLEGLFSQSNFGVVTKAGVWLMPRPEAYNSFVFQLSWAKDFGRVLDVLRALALQRVLPTTIHMINAFVSLAVLTRYPFHLLQDQTFLPEEVIARLQQEYGVAPWTFSTGLYGTRAQVRVNRAIVKKALKPYGRLEFLDDRKVRWVSQVVPWLKRAQSYPLLAPLSRWVVRGGLRSSLALFDAVPYIHGILKGIPTEYFVRHAYFKSNHPRPDQDVHPARDSCGLFWFAPILPFTGQAVSEFLNVAQGLFHEQGFDLYVALLVMNPRSIVALMAILYRKEDAAETHRASVLYERLCALVLSEGYQQYRAAMPAWRGLFDQAPGFLKLCDTLKSAVDPNNIMAPGHYGIGLSHVRPHKDTQ